MPPRRRADIVLVERGLFESRAKAQAAIAAGLVTADEARVRKPSDEIAVDAALRAEPAFSWVSRGGVKLAAALERFGVDVAGRVCLDVGTGQLHPRLRGRADIVAMERTDIRALDPAALYEPPDVVTIDVSFISLKLVLPAAIALAARPADIIALIKPQFELTRTDTKKGIVRDPEMHRRVCDEIAGLAAALGLTAIAQVRHAHHWRRRQPRILHRRPPWLII